jgi:hypothetical protein
MSRTRIPSFCTLILLLFSLVPAIEAQPVPASPYPSDPYIVTPPATTSVKLGSAASFTVVAWSAKTLKYQWFKNSQQINGANAAKYTTPATTSSDNGSGFYVQVSNGTSSLNSNPATLWVDASVPTIGQQPASQTVQAPAVASFQAYAYDGNNDITAQWYKNGSPVGSVQGGYATYSITETSTADSGAKFTVKFTNGAGSVTSNPAVLTVKPANISGTYPIVGEWTGTATITNPDKTVTKMQALAAFSQNSYSLTATVVYVDDNGIPEVGAGIASLNNLAVFTAIGGDPSFEVAGAFSTNLLSFSGTGLGSDGSVGSAGTGQFTISADHNTLTGTGALSDGTAISWNLTRAK